MDGRTQSRPLIQDGKAGDCADDTPSAGAIPALTAYRQAAGVIVDCAPDGRCGLWRIPNSLSKAQNRLVHEQRDAFPGLGLVVLVAAL